MVSCGTDFLLFHTCSEIRLGTFMLIEKRVEVVTVKVSALFKPKDDQFPHLPSRSTRSRQAGLSLPAFLYRQG